MTDKFIVTFDLGTDTSVSFGPFDSEHEAEDYACTGAHGLDDHVDESEVLALYSPEDTI